MPRTIFAALLRSTFASSWSGIFRQKIWQESFFDRGERADGFEIAQAAAIALGLQAFDAGDALIWNQDVAEFAAESFAAFDDVAVDDDAAAETGADDDRDRSFFAVGSENREVSPERAGVAVVQVGDGLAEFTREAFANVEAGPVGVDEVGRAFGAELAGGAGGAGSVEADGDDVGQRNFREVGGDFQAVFDLLEADVGALFGEGRMLAEPFDQEFFIARDQRVVDRCTAQIDSRNDFHVGLPNETSPVLKRFK